MKIYTETQQFRQWWIWALIIAITVIVLLGALFKGNGPADTLGAIIPLSLVLLFYLMRLDTRIDETGIHYRFFPITSWRHVAWAHISTAEVRQFSFVGYGIRWDFECWYYIIAGQQGLRITRTNGGPIVIGTRQPDQLREFLADIRPAVQA